jgi:hypothetical protein
VRPAAAIGQGFWGAFPHGGMGVILSRFINILMISHVWCFWVRIDGGGTEGWAGFAA